MAKQKPSKKTDKGQSLSPGEQVQLQMLLDRVAVQDPAGESLKQFLGSVRSVLEQSPGVGLAFVEALGSTLTVMVVLNVGDRIVGVVVDSVFDVVALAAEQIRPNPDLEGAVDPRFVTGIGALDLEQAGFTVAGEADSVEGTRGHPGLAAAQVAILDLSLDHANGLDLIPDLCRRGVRVVVYSMHEDAAIVRRTLAAGAKGYIT